MLLEERRCRQPTNASTNDHEEVAAPGATRHSQFSVEKILHEVPGEECISDPLRHEADLANCYGGLSGTAV